MGAAAGEPPVVAGVELGGTKSLVVLARGSTIIDRLRVPTLEPATTLAALSDQLADWQAGGRDSPPSASRSFGPVGLDRSRADFGHITSTPKAGWPTSTSAVTSTGASTCRSASTPTTAGAALAERAWGAAAGCDVRRVPHDRHRPRRGDRGRRSPRPRPRPSRGRTPARPPACRRRVPRRAAPSTATASRAWCPARRSPLGPASPGTARPRPTTGLGRRRGRARRTAGDADPHRVPPADRRRRRRGLGQPFLLDRVRPAIVDVARRLRRRPRRRAMERLIRPPALGDDAGPLGAAALALEALTADRDVPGRDPVIADGGGSGTRDARRGRNLRSCRPTRPPAADAVRAAIGGRRGDPVPGVPALALYGAGRVLRSEPGRAAPRGLHHVPRGRPAVRHRARPLPRRRVAAASIGPTRSPSSTPERRPARWPGRSSPPAGCRGRAALRRGRGRPRLSAAEHPATVESTDRLPDGPFDGVIARQRAARQHPVPPGRVRRRVARGVRADDGERFVEVLSSPLDPCPPWLPRPPAHGARVPLVERAGEWVADAAARLRERRPCSIARLRPPDHGRTGGLDRGATGCAPTGATSGASTTSPHPAARTSRSTSRSTSSPKPTRCAPKPSSSAASASTSWSRRDGRSGRPARQPGRPRRAAHAQPVGRGRRPARPRRPRRLHRPRVTGRGRLS